MNVWDVLILLAVAALVAGAVALMRGRRKKCGGCCEGCSMRGEHCGK